MKCTLRFAEFERLALIGHAASTDRARPILQSLYIEASGVEASDSLIITATDAYKMAQTTVAAAVHAQGDCLIPAQGAFDVVSTVRALARTHGIRRQLLVDADIQLTAQGRDVSITARYGAVELVALTLPATDGTYPSYANPFPTEEALNATHRAPALALNPHHSQLLMKTVPSDGAHPVVWRFLGEHAPVLMTCGADPAWKGIVMPVRIHAAR